MTITNYHPPVDKLLTLGDVGTMPKWLDYRAYGLGVEHIPDLIRMALDEELRWTSPDDQAAWAPIHAWRALGQLRAESAVEPLLGLLHQIDDDQDDWTGEEIPEVMGMIGPAAIPALAAYVADSSHGLWASVAASASLKEIGQRHPAARTECVATLTRLLEQYQDHDKTVNAELVAGLIALHAVESAPVIESAFAAGCVDISVSGDWEDVQVELGLARERTTPRPDYLAESFGPELSASLDDLSQRIQIAKPPFQPKRTKAKAKKGDKRKQQEPRGKNKWKR